MFLGYLEYALVVIIALVLLGSAALALLYLIDRERGLLIVHAPVLVFTWCMVIAILLGLKGVALMCVLCLFCWIIALGKLAELLS